MPSTETLSLIEIALNIVVAIVGLTWGIAKVRDTVRDEMFEHKDLMELKLNTLRHDMGEMGAALRAKVTEIELFGRDTYMRRDSFYKTLEMLSTDIRAQFAKLDIRLDKLEDKIDGQAHKQG